MVRRLDFLGSWKWPNLVVISVVPVAAYFLSWAPQHNPRSFGTAIFGPERLGPWVVVVGIHDQVAGAVGSEVTVNVRFCSGCYEQIRSAALAFGAADGPLEPGKPIVGDPNALQVALAVPEIAPPSGLYLWVTAEDWSGRRHRTFWKVLPEATAEERTSTGIRRTQCCLLVVYGNRLHRFRPRASVFTLLVNSTVLTHSLISGVTHVVFNKAGRDLLRNGAKRTGGLVWRKDARVLPPSWLP
jgi:hypothetical protein